MFVCSGFAVTVDFVPDITSLFEHARSGVGAGFCVFVQFSLLASLFRSTRLQTVRHPYKKDPDSDPDLENYPYRSPYSTLIETLYKLL